MIHLNLKQQLLCFMQHAHYLYVRIPYVFKMGTNIHQSSQQSNSIQYTCRDLFTFFFIFISWKKMTVPCDFVSQTIASLRKDLVPGKALQKKKVRETTEKQLQIYRILLRHTTHNTFSAHILRFIKHTSEDYRIYITRYSNIHCKIIEFTSENYRVYIKGY